MSSYPKETPRSKHDICSPSTLTSHTPISTLESLTSILQGEQPPSNSLSITRLAAVYTYKDAPVRPKPLSGKLRIEHLMRYELFQRVTSYHHEIHDESTMKKCTIAVKLPATIRQYAHDTKKYEADMSNSKSFRDFLKMLYNHQNVALLSPDSAGRIGFLAPFQFSSNKNDEEEEWYAARLYYSPLNEFLACAQRNYDASASSCVKEENIIETWTPQYTPPPEEECGPSQEWDDNSAILQSWTPQYTPPPEEECHAAINQSEDKAAADEPPLFQPESDDVPLFQPESNDMFVPPKSEDDNLFVPPGDTDFSKDYGVSGYGALEQNGGWDTTDNTSEANNEASIGQWTQVEQPDMTAGTYHANESAAAADAFYSNLTRSLDTRADSRLYHMRAFNGWVKATQIAELDPDTVGVSNAGGKKRSRRSPLRVLDLACGKGGDLGKWTIHQRKIENYVGVDVARGSLIDAALRARQMVKRGTLKRCTFSLADLGEDVPGRKRSKNAKRMQKLLTWNLESETIDEREYDPKFVMQEGGGIAETDKFDVVSIQFAIHYMMSTRKRARRFFHTVSSLLEIGGNLIATTIDARVVVEKLMALGKDFHFDDEDQHEEIDLPENERRHGSGNKRRKVDDSGATVIAGDGVCRLKFDRDILQRVFSRVKTTDDMFGLQYTFTLSEGDDHAAGVGEAVDLPEWLTPIPALKELGEEAGLELEYATNFHKFYEERKDPARYTGAHNALFNMRVLNRNGSISEQEWDVSRMYIAVKFRKVKESQIEIGDEDVGADEMLDPS